MDMKVREAIKRIKTRLDDEMFVSEEQLDIMMVLDWIEELEEEYEYALQATELESGKVWAPKSFREFGTLAETKEAFDLHTKEEDAEVFGAEWRFDIVRRRKAGPLEIYKDEEGE